MMEFRPVPKPKARQKPDRPKKAVKGGLKRDRRSGGNLTRTKGIRKKRAGVRRGQEPIHQLRRYVQDLPCLVSGEYGVECCQYRTKRNGGDLGNLFPLAPRFHEEQHRTGIASFQTKYGLDLQSTCWDITYEWVAATFEAQSQDD